jgi:hypothetical protein
MKYTNIEMDWTANGAKVLSSLAIPCPVCQTVVTPNVEHLCGDSASEAEEANGDSGGAMTELEQAKARIAELEAENARLKEAVHAGREKWTAALNRPTRLDAALRDLAQLLGVAATPEAVRNAVQDRGRTEIDICIVDRDAIFICGVWGSITADAIEAIEKDLAEPGEWIDHAPDNAITVRCSVEWVPDQRGAYGMVELAGYWDLTFLRVTELDTAIPEHGEKDAPKVKNLMQSCEV